MSVKCLFNFDSSLTITDGVLKDDTGNTSWKVLGSPTVQTNVTKFGSSAQLNPRIFETSKYAVI